MTDKIIENIENNEGMRDGAWDAAAVEAILFASGCPVTYEKIGEALSMTEIEARDFVKELVPRYEGRGIELIAYPDSCVLCSRAEYEEKIGSIEREILAAQMYLREKQRILEELRAQLNRQEIMSYERAKEKAEKERQEFEEDLHRHIHLENNVLFPKAVELEKEVLN